MTDINLRSVVAATSADGGLTSLRRICTDFNFPEPANCERSMAEAAKKLRKIIVKDEIDDGRIINVAVSVDGAWQKRYGHNSLNGMVFVISIDTGYVLDYIVKTKFCHICKSNGKKIMIKNSV